MTSAAEFLRDLAGGLEVVGFEDLSTTPDIERLNDIADDLDAILPEAVPHSGSGAIFEAVQRLRGAA